MPPRLNSPCLWFNNEAHRIYQRSETLKYFSMLAANLSRYSNVKGDDTHPPESSAFCTGSRLNKAAGWNNSASNRMIPNCQPLWSTSNTLMPVSVPTRREANSVVHQYSVGTQMHYLTVQLVHLGHWMVIKVFWGGGLLKDGTEAPSMPVNQARPLRGTILKNSFSLFRELWRSGAANWKETRCSSRWSEMYWCKPSVIFMSQKSTHKLGKPCFIDWAETNWDGASHVIQVDADGAAIIAGRPGWV